MILTICDLEHDRIAGYTATFTRMFTSKLSSCVPNMVIGRARRPSGGHADNDLKEKNPICYSWD